MSKKKDKIMITSMFPHEEQALNTIVTKFKNHFKNQVAFIPNYFLFDYNNNQYLECDLIAISSDQIAIIELKHWAGKIEIKPHTWIVNNSQHRTDPHISNKYKCQVLKGYFQREFPTYPNIWVESIVVLTNPNADIYNESFYKTKNNNPTFIDSETLFKHYKHKAETNVQKKLNIAQIQNIAKKFKTDGGVPNKKQGFNLPGYTIIENVTKTSEKIEVLCRSTESTLQSIKRFRIFSLKDSFASQTEQLFFNNKIYNSLKSIEKIGDNKNIIKIFQIPNEDGLVIEGSDWSEEGTLADIIQSQQPFSLNTSVVIIQGILSGLIAVHKENLIHRDLSPSNILMRSNVPKIMNFDLSYHLEDDHLTVLADSQKIKPNPYIAPEIYNREDISEATDFFSVGVIFFELLTGSTPFKKSSQLINEKEMSKNALKQLKSNNVSEEIQIILNSLIQFDRTKRPQKAIDILNDIQEACENSIIIENVSTNRRLKKHEMFDVYEIINFLGRGKASQVYKAKQKNNKFTVLKIFDLKIKSDKIYKEQGAMEIAKCPYVTHCETINKHSAGQYYLVMNYIDGRSLRVDIDNNKLPDPIFFQKILTCLFEALNKMHNNQTTDHPLLHNDIKPENILISKNIATLIDFGISSQPHIGTYMGTAGYKAPDLIQSIDFEYCESGDLFALGVTMFEWFYGKKPYNKPPSINSAPINVTALRQDASEELSHWLNKAVQPLKQNRFNNIQEMITAFELIFKKDNKKEVIENIDNQNSYDYQTPPDSVNQNEFVEYLNSLHNVTPANENALAESQAQNDFFGSIHVPLELTDFIATELSSKNGSNVILTGHAGDGKSTIGLELYKKFNNLPMENPLPDPMKIKEKFNIKNGLTLHQIKDMSELSVQERLGELDSACNIDLDKERRFIISNTGTLLSSLKDFAQEKQLNWLDVEPQILELLQKTDPGTIKIKKNSFTIINLAQIDNSKIVETLLDKIIHGKYWEKAASCPYKEKCPITLNIKSLQEFYDISKKRIIYIYRLLYEYGHRLTIRQITAHVAYAITGGLNCNDIANFAAQPIPPNITDFLFCNSFFGFKGAAFDEQSIRLIAIQQIRPFEMGAKPYPPIERVLWQEENSVLPQLPTLISPILTKMCNKIKYGTILEENKISISRFRQEIRRLLYIYGDFPDKISQYLPIFLDSHMLLDFIDWQKNNIKLETGYMQSVKRKVLHVLQEQFTGINLPDSSEFHHLFITLKRKEVELRQSVQILIAKIPMSNFSLKFKQINKKVPPKRYSLILYEKDSKEELQLDLPFIDFVMMRNAGEIGQKLDMSYIDRLERFKSLLLSLTNYKAKTNLELLEVTNTGILKTRGFSFNDDIIEVNDVY